MTTNNTGNSQTKGDSDLSDSPGFCNNYGYHQMYIDRRGEQRIMSYEIIDENKLL